MNRFENVSRVSALVVIWLLVAVGVLAGIAVPFGAASLSQQYSEYSGDFLAITTMLLLPVLLSESLLGVILVLLRRVRIDQMFSRSAHGWVRTLSYNAAALSLSFGVILFWLNAKNTLPPAVGLMLLLAMLLPLAVALVTRTLLGFLQKATTDHEELEGVI